jgi:hypothetical protein
MSATTFNADSTLGEYLDFKLCCVHLWHHTGALLIGTLVSYALFGVTTTQVYIYYGRFPQDSWRLKSLVVAAWYVHCLHRSRHR